MAKAKTMTVARLHKQLSEMVQNGQGWMKVAVNKRSFHHPLESDGAVILDVQSAAFTWVPLTDDDGGTAMRKDGTEIGVIKVLNLDGVDCTRSIMTNPHSEATSLSSLEA